MLKICWPLWHFVKVLIRFHDAAVKLGFPLVPDANSPHAPADGIATLDSIVDENGERMSTSRAFLPTELAHARKANLTICPNMIVSRIEFSGNKESKRAERVHFLPNDGGNSGRSYSARIKKEAIVCSGTLGSPQVLMLRFVS
jgi:choline dehydrogenase-like flavoprotein